MIYLPLLITSNEWYIVTVVYFTTNSVSSPRRTLTHIKFSIATFFLVETVAGKF